VLLNARGHGAMREKGGGVGSVPRGGKIGAEREGYAAVPRELAQHRRSGSRPLGQRWAAHVAPARLRQGRRQARAMRSAAADSGA
jgi:hypothetical protein